MLNKALRYLFFCILAAPLLAAAACPAPSGAAGWNGWADPANTRFQDAKTAGLTTQTVPRLELKWAFGFPNVTTAFGAPAAFGGRVFAGAADGSVYALDTHTGCTFWVFSAAAGVRVAPVLDENGKAVYFGDLKANVYSLDVQSGHLLWKTRADGHPMAVITGSPKFYAGRLYVPVSGRDESMAATNPAYPCCTFRGSVVALDAATGRRIWQTYTIAAQPKPTGQNAKGAKTWGPSGAVPWSSPTLDLRRQALYIGTGVNYSQPATATSDAIVAIDMNSGRLLWTRQFTAGDAYNFACGPTADKTNCPRSPFIDADFGNSGMLRSLPGGKRILVASDKSGMVWAIDPDREGAIVWKRKIAAGGVNGGTMWGGASDEHAAYIGISDFTAGKPEIGGGLVALQLATGEKLWQTPAPKPACLGKPGCSAAQPAPATAIPGVVFLGSWDGHIRAYAATGGKIIWDFDALRDFPTVNGVKAHGGSINSVGPAIAGGMLYITSGYSGNGMQGNVLLAFSPNGK